MKNIVVVALALLINLVPSAQAEENCIPAVMKIAADPLLSWRSGRTHQTEDKQVFATNAKREAEIKAEEEYQLDWIKAKKSTPEMLFIEIPGTEINYVIPKKKDKIPVYEVSGAKVADGKLKGTLLLPVSGHAGSENADKWRTTDTYDLYIKDAAGKQTFLAKGAKSLDYVTHHELEVPLKKGEKVSLYYSRSGSGGPGGYPEGRTIDIIWK